MSNAHRVAFNTHQTVLFPSISFSPSASLQFRYRYICCTYLNVHLNGLEHRRSFTQQQYSFFINSAIYILFYAQYKYFSTLKYLHDCILCQYVWNMWVSVTRLYLFRQIIITFQFISRAMTFCSYIDLFTRHFRISIHDIH